MNTPLSFITYLTVFIHSLTPLTEPPYLTVGTDVSAKYRGAFCEAKIKTAKRLVKAKVTLKPDLTTVEVNDDSIQGPLKVGAVVEVKNPDGVYQEASINKLTDCSIYTVGEGWRSIAASCLGAGEMGESKTQGWREALLGYSSL
uniref:Tudor domain-containing protein n=1 Tax=Hucho hucho TaxID=62062 RepID=A0A4W5QZ74_9TELE